MIKSPEEGRLVHPKYQETSSRISLCWFVISVSIWSSWGRYYFGVDLRIITGLLCCYPVAPYRFFAKDSVTTGWLWSLAVRLARALWYGRLGKSLHGGDPLLNGKLKVRRIRYVKLFGMLLQYAFFFLWKRVRSAWLVWQERELLISRHIYLSYKKLKKSFAIFSEFKTFRYIWLCRPSCSLGIYKKFLVTLLFQSLVLRVKNAWLRTLSIRYGRCITQQRL